MLSYQIIANSKNNLINFLMILFPFSFIAGNMLININSILLILSGLLFFSKDLIKIKFNLLDKLFISFFFLILLTGLINDYEFYIEGLDDWMGFFPTTVKSILFLRYLLFYLILRILISKQIINYKFFFISCAVASLFVSFDIFFQYIFNVDIFGYEVKGRHFSGPFGDEKIAGGFIQRFFIFTLFILPIFFDKFKYFKIIIIILVLIFFAAILLSGNRMPFILFLLSLFLTGILIKNIRKFLIPVIVILTIAFFSVYKLAPKIGSNFYTFANQVSNIYSFIISDNQSISENKSQYLKDFYSFYGTWELNKFIGGGLKNFRYYCHVKDKKYDIPGFTCNMHPHNYYLEILTETGVIGGLIILIVLLNIVYLIYSKKFIFSSKIKYDYLSVPFIILLFTEFFPIRSSGSFFTTSNATFIFLIAAIFVSIITKENLSKKLK